MKLSRRSFMKANAVAAAAAAGRCPRRCWSAGSHQMG